MAVNSLEALKESPDSNIRFCLSGDSLWLPNLTSLWFHYQIPNFFFIGKGKPS